MVVIESAGITDLGKKRKINEDSLLLDDPQRFYVVSDGMGGHQAGEVASALVVATMHDYIKRFATGEPVEELEDADPALSKQANRLLASINLANKAVFQLAQSKQSLQGMGATVSAAFFTDDTLIVANVGDSPVYLIHEGNIELLSVIHNVVTEQAALNPDAARHIAPQFKHMLTRAMGMEETVRPDLCEIQCFRGDTLVMSSDGLTDNVAPNEILEILQKERPEKACRTLVDLSNDRGGHDNITVIALRVRALGNERRSFFSNIIHRLVFWKKDR